MVCVCVCVLHSWEHSVVECFGKIGGGKTHV